MANDDDAFQAPPDGPEPLDWSKKQHFRKLFTRQAVSSYLYLSFGMGVIALSLPILLLLVDGYDHHYSISNYFYGSDLARTIFTGCLCAIGAFLLLFRGLSRRENWTLNVAGVAAFSVAMNPANAVQCPGHGLSVHLISAILFFVCLAIVAIFFSKDRIKFIIYPPLKRRFTLAYNIAGAAMIAMPAGVAAFHYLFRRECESPWIFWIESFGIWGFSFYWFVKTQEYRMLLGVPWRWRGE